MVSLWAIIKLTFKSAIRSHIFQLLLAVLLVCVLVIPYTIAGDGTAWGFIQVSLKYSLGIVGLILSLSTVWLCCYVMTQDVESYQLHMVIVKPSSRIKVWLGKCLGVILIHLVLIVISTTAVYLLIKYQFYHKKFSDAEKERIECEVMVGRRAFMPMLPDVNKIVAMEYQRRLKVAQANGGNVEEIKQREPKVLAEIKKEYLAMKDEVPPFVTKTWVYQGIDPKLETPLFLRYKPYVGKISPKKTQRESKGVWFAELNMKVRTEDVKVGEKKATDTATRLAKKGAKPQTQAVWVARSQMPEGIMCGSYNEIVLPPNAVSPEGRVMIGFMNCDPEGKSIFFQGADGPKLLTKVCGFEQNYARAVMMIFLKVVFLAGLSCAIASFVSMPVAIFTIISYMLFGIFANYLVGAEAELLDSGAGLASMELLEQIGTIVSKILLVFVIPLQDFEVSDIIAEGHLIEWSYIGVILFNFFVLRWIPFVILGIYLYWNREMGLVVRK